MKAERRIGLGWSRWSLAWRLLLPLVVLAVGLGGAVTWFLVRTISTRMDQAVDARLAELADGLAGGGFALEEDLLRRVRAVTSNEVVILSPQGAVIASSLDPASAATLAAQIGTGADSLFLSLGDDRYRVLSRSVATGGPDSRVRLVVAASSRSTDAMKHELVRIVLGAVGVGLLLSITVGLLVVNSATRPLARLARAAREAGEGDLRRQVPGGGGRELQAVAREFNEMLGELARSRKELVRVERLAAAGTMAAGVAHEIRNPLAAIRMNIQLLARDRDAKTRAEIDDVLFEIDRLELVVGNLLDIAAPPRLAASAEDLNEIVRGTLRVMASKLRHLAIDVRLQLAEDLPRVSVDAHKLRQALLNVILNAAEAMPRGGTLRVSTTCRDSCIELVFEDTGIGITTPQRERVFEPFFSTKQRGAGLGLHVVKSILETHGARVRLEPGERCGARCIMELPAPAAERKPA